jgi:hypothetical protein
MDDVVVVRVRDSRGVGDVELFLGGAHTTHGGAGFASFGLWLFR